jgi:hypothetical protein
LDASCPRWANLAAKRSNPIATSCLPQRLYRTKCRKRDAMYSGLFLTFPRARHALWGSGRSWRQSCRCNWRVTTSPTTQEGVIKSIGM